MDDTASMDAQHKKDQIIRFCDDMGKKDLLLILRFLKDNARNHIKETAMGCAVCLDILSEDVLNQLYDICKKNVDDYEAANR